MASERGRQIHGKAEQARENGNFLEALQLAEEATQVYIQDKDMVGASEVRGSKLLTYRHLSETTGDENWLILAKHAAEESVEMAEKSGILKALSMPYFNLAKAQETLGELGNAIISYKKAIETKKANPGEFHNRIGVMADMEIHLAVCEYKKGDKTAIERIQKSLNELENSDEPKYNKDVWMSGAYMKLGEIFKDDSAKANEYLAKAEVIINSNPDLKLRKSQLGKLKTKLNV